MNVDELQLHLSNLSQLLRGGGGRRPADALDEFCERLQPFRERKLKDVLDLLAQADEIVRTGTPPPRKSSPRKPKTDPQLLENLGNRVVHLYEHARDPETTRELIEAAFAELNRANPTGAQLQVIAKRIDITQKLSKAKLLETMQRVVLERKGVFTRVQV